MTPWIEAKHVLVALVLRWLDLNLTILCENHGADTATKVQVQRMARVLEETQENHGYLIIEEGFVIRTIVEFLFYILE